MLRTINRCTPLDRRQFLTASRQLLAVGSIAGKPWVMTRLLILLTFTSCTCDPASEGDTGTRRADVAGDDVAGGGDSARPQDTPDDTPSAPQLGAAATLTYEIDEDAAVQSIALSPDGRRVAAAGWDGRVVIFDIETGAATEVAAFGTGSVTVENAMAWAGDRIAIGRFEGLMILDPEGNEIAARDSRTRGVTAVGDAFLHVSTRELERLDIAGSVVASTPVVDAVDIVANADEAYVLTEVDVEYSVVVFDAETLTELRRLPIDTRALYGGGDVLAGTVLDTTTLYDTDGAVLRTLASFEGDDPAALAFSGPWVAHLGFREGVALFDVATGSLLAQAPGATGRGIVLDGDRRVFAGGEGGVLVYDIVRE